MIRAWEHKLNAPGPSPSARSSLRAKRRDLISSSLSFVTISGSTDKSHISAELPLSPGNGILAAMRRKPLACPNFGEIQTTGPFVTAAFTASPLRFSSAHFQSLGSVLRMSAASPSVAIASLKASCECACTIPLALLRHSSLKLTLFSSLLSGSTSFLSGHSMPSPRSAQTAQTSGYRSQHEHPFRC